MARQEIGTSSVFKCVALREAAMSLLNITSRFITLPTISLLLQSIIDYQLFPSYCLTIVSEDTIDIHFNLTFTYITPKKTIEELTDQLLEVSERGCSDYIVNMRDQIFFMIAFDLVSKIGNIRRSDRKIVFLPPQDDTDYRNHALNLFSTRQTDFVANILMVVPDTDTDSKCDVFNLVTQKFGGTNQESDQPWYLNQWDSCTQNFKLNSALFPHDMTNLHGKTVKVACFTYKPYVFLDLDHVTAKHGRDGIDLRIVEEFCRWVNCTVMIVNERKNQWGEVYDNGTGIGVLGSVVEDRADMGISALYSWYEEFLYLDFSAACVRSGITCLAPSPRLLKSWEMPLMPFSWYMWYAVVVTFILSGIALIVAKDGSFDEVFLTVFGVMIAQSRPNADSSWRIRRVTGWLLMAGLILVSAYGAGLASTFTVPKYEASIDTITDLVDRNMEWGATHDAWIFSLVLSPEPLVKKLVSQFRITPANELKKRSFMRNMAFSIEKLPAGYFAIGDYLTKDALLDLTLMLEDFYYEQCVVMLRKSSPYTEKISALIGRLHQSGLIIAWETQVSLKYMNFEVQQEVRLSRSRSHDHNFAKPLGYHHVVGIFIMYAFGIVISILVFVVEVLSKRSKYN